MIKNMPEPISVEEKYLYSIIIRLDAVVNMLSSFVEVYGGDKKIAITSNKVEEKQSTKRKRKVGA